ncbi:hypothetical protein niasHT_013888 [Heterodera trifolii]|uniref:BTB domain-containing protein n=1 Tax=Heterodera trifolii TaxID=157864 RepID=A0ABD2KTN1_9BILA
MSKSAIAGLKSILSTGEHADVHFLRVPAHKFILKNASDVFAAMFRFDPQNANAENDFANCPVVEMPDVEAAAFKVMLSFIYAGDLSGLNGDNAMAVLYAAKKYNIPGLVGPSLKIPISELRNVFVAYVQARLFDLERIVVLCLARHSSKFAFRFEEFAKDIDKIPSGVLTTQEVIDVQQHKIKPNYDQFNSEERIWTDGTLLMDIEKVSKLPIQQNCTHKGTAMANCGTNNNRWHWQ